MTITFRILFLLDDLGAGGAQRQVVLLSKGFYSLGHDITVFTYSDNSFYKKELIEAGIKVYNLSKNRIFRRLIEVRKFIRKGGFNCVISFLGPPNFLNIISALPKKKWNVIVNERSANPALFKSIRSRIIRFSYIFADTVISNSHANIRIVYKINPLLPNQKSKVIYNAVDLLKYQPLQQFKFKSEGTLRIVIPASYRRLKNILNLIEAINILPNHEQTRLLVKWYGDKTMGLHRDGVLNEAIDLIHRYHLHSIIQLMPLKLEILDTIQNADAIGLFSFFEGFPNAVCEGMACGKPIIASSISDIPLFIKDGENGFLCDPHSIYSIKNALQNLLNCSDSKLEDMGRTNRLKAIELFSKDNIIEKYLDLIR
jgi:glycosyltransferase involved in cell wall biosynthesis